MGAHDSRADCTAQCCLLWRAVFVDVEDKQRAREGTARGQTECGEGEQEQPGIGTQNKESAARSWLHARQRIHSHRARGAGQ